MIFGNNCSFLRYCPASRSSLFSGNVDSVFDLSYMQITPYKFCSRSASDIKKCRQEREFVMAAKKMLESQTNRVINGHINSKNHGHTTNESRAKFENPELKFCITEIRYMYTRFDVTYILRYTYTNTLRSYEIYYFYDVNLHHRNMLYGLLICLKQNTKVPTKRLFNAFT